jgi:hypothetical protein
VWYCGSSRNNPCFEPSVADSPSGGSVGMACTLLIRIG